MTRGRAATSDLLDLSAVSRSDRLLDALASRRSARPSPGSAAPSLGSAEADDPAVRLLAALAADVEDGAPPLPAPTRVARVVSESGRTVVRAILTFGVAAVVLTTAGAAAAGGGRAASGPRAAPLVLSVRSNANLRREAHPTDHRSWFREAPSSGRAIRNIALLAVDHRRCASPRKPGGGVSGSALGLEVPGSEAADRAPGSGPGDQGPDPTFGHQRPGRTVGGRP